MRANPEYQLYRAVAAYLNLQYPRVLYHFDPTGLHLTKTQAGQLKAIQGGSGYPDLFIMEPRGACHGLFIEIKPEGTRIFKRNGHPSSDHIGEQLDFINKLKSRGYYAFIASGFDQIRYGIDEYLNGIVKNK